MNTPYTQEGQPYKMPTPLDADSFRQANKRFAEAKSDIRRIITAFEKQIEIINAMDYCAKELASHAEGICDTYEETNKVSVSSIAAFYSELKSLEVYIFDFKNNRENINSIPFQHEAILERIAKNAEDGISCCQDLPLYKTTEEWMAKQSVDKTPTSRNDG